MKLGDSKGIRFLGMTVVGGFVAGSLMALAVPTTQRQEGQDWRKLVGLSDRIEDPSPALTFEGPPEDLVPVQWMTAQQEYPSAMRDDPYVLPPVDADTYAAYDSDVPEPLPAALLDRQDVAVISDDEAGNAAEAARDAASDVRVVESTAATTADAPGDDAATALPAPVGATVMTIPG